MVREGFQINPAALADALGTIARSRGMSDLAKASGVTREALYKALRPECQPAFRDDQQGLRGARVRRVAAQPIDVPP